MLGGSEKQVTDALRVYEVPHGRLDEALSRSLIGAGSVFVQSKASRTAEPTWFTDTGRTAPVASQDHQ